jgi:hypothetical protein
VRVQARLEIFQGLNNQVDLSVNEIAPTKQARVLSQDCMDWFV